MSTRLSTHAAGRLQRAGSRRRCACFLYTRGDIDILPAGMSEIWEEHAPNTSLYLQLSPSLLAARCR